MAMNNTTVPIRKYAKNFNQLKFLDWILNALCFIIAIG